MNELYSLLKQLIAYYNMPAAKFDRSCYRSRYEAVEDINAIITQLNARDNQAIDRLSFLFSPAGDVQKIARSSGWEAEFEDLAAQVGQYVGLIRNLQKQDASVFDGARDGKYTNTDSWASCPGRLCLSPKKWEEIKILFQLGFFQRNKMRGNKRRVQEYIRFGDTQPAVVISCAPLLIAAFSDEMDAVALLQFPDRYVQQYGLKPNDRLVAVNVYDTRSLYDDLYVGKNYLKRYRDFLPSIGDFLSEETEKLEQHKSSIPESVWHYVQSLGETYVRRYDRYRKGFWFL